MAAVVSESLSGDPDARSVFHAFDCTHDPCSCEVRLVSQPTAVEVVAKAFRSFLFASATRSARIAIDALQAAGFYVVRRGLLDSLVEEDDCWFDHHGGCQAHGYLSLAPGEKCPQQELKELLQHTDGER